MISEDNDKRICDTYPGLFRVGPNGTFGFECRAGWLGLIETLCQMVAQAKGTERAEEMRFVQIKEKFGALRVYYVGGNTVISAYVSFAEAMSQKMCEVCGSPAQMVSTGGWMRARCEMHEVET